MLNLPGNGGRYMFSVNNVGNKIMMTSVLTLNKAIYTSGEYPYLKELLSKVSQSYQTSLVFQKKS